MHRKLSLIVLLFSHLLCGAGEPRKVGESARVSSRSAPSGLQVKQNQQPDDRKRQRSQSAPAKSEPSPYVDTPCGASQSCYGAPLVR